MGNSLNIDEYELISTAENPSCIRGLRWRVKLSLLKSDAPDTWFNDLKLQIEKK